MLWIVLKSKVTIITFLITNKFYLKHIVTIVNIKRSVYSAKLLSIHSFKNCEIKSHSFLIFHKDFAYHYIELEDIKRSAWSISN